LITLKDKKRAMCVVIRGTRPLVSFQCKFGNESGRKLPHVNNINRWLEQLKGTGSVCERRSSGRPAGMEARM